MIEKETKPAPLPSIRRLPLYLRCVRELREKGFEEISCTRIAEELDGDPTQIRKDLSITGVVGRPKTGYHSLELMEAIQAFLGWDNTTDAFLVGAGSLGRALLGYPNFRERNGLNICAAFDVDPEKIGKRFHGCEVFPMDKLPDLAQRLHVKIGVLTTPADPAQELAEMMREAGLRAIWNFCPVKLRLPEDVIVEDVMLKTSLAVLTNRLKDLLNREKKEMETHAYTNA